MKYIILKTTVGERESFQRGRDKYQGYLDLLQQKGHLIIAGNFDDRSGGMLLIEAEDMEQAVAIARMDPMVRAGVDRYQVRGWTPWGPEVNGGGSVPDARAPVDSGPLTSDPFEESFEVVAADEHPRGGEMMTHCFASEQLEEGNTVRREYLRRVQGRGLQKLLLVHSRGGEKVAGQIEYAPAEVSALPIQGERLTVINCIWVLDACSGLGGGSMLLAGCAERVDSESLATVAFNATLPWLGKGFFIRQGFTILDQAETGRFFGNTPIVAYLLWRPLREGASPPTWDRTRLAQGINHCPGYPWMSGRRLYWGREYAYHGSLVKEGLRRPEVLSQFPVLGTHRAEKWTFVKIGVPEADLNRALDLLQSALLDEPTYFAHLYGQGNLIAVYPTQIFRMTRDPKSWSEAIQYGIAKGIPEEEVIFSPCTFEEETF
jgi:uncharacterized protein YciI/ribosomal protein S18 acetylase RimI-like enzyme